MVIVNAIREADTAYVVYFLLEAYLNTASRRLQLARVAPESIRVPVTGRHDVSMRYESLQAKLAADEFIAERTASRDAIEEALAVFAAALLKLDEFAETGLPESVDVATAAQEGPNASMRA